MRSRGRWRGLLTVEAGVSAPLALSGTRTEPHAQALAAAREVAQAFASWRPAIEQALFEHYEPYAEAVTAGELPSPSEALLRIAAPGNVWSHPPLGTTSTRLELDFSKEGSSTFVAVFCLRKDDAQPSIKRTHIGAPPVRSRREAAKRYLSPGS